MASRKKTGIDQSKLITVMKKFIGTRQSDPEHTKYFKIENNVDYLAVDLNNNGGLAAHIYLKNRELWKKETGEVKFAIPTSKDKVEFKASIPEYPDVKSVFHPDFLRGYNGYKIGDEDVDKFIKVHESMEKIGKMSGKDFVTVLNTGTNFLLFTIAHSDVEFMWKYETEMTEGHDTYGYPYDPSIMVNAFKALKDLKAEGIKMFLKDNKSPIFFTAMDNDYEMNIAVQRKLMRDGE
ncbi:hypothetical protein Staley_22 [Bacillus phage Staley]|uniref:Uncharacterized protein n=1 Tax=Bacillus phage Staley TaxID=1406792 RepID=U5PXH4_9CAUD|nr:hypothetical protein Staley_22 [Bacillus phage Staley]AGY48705.1 hypothetical protein Staley_22 [Bacillus phage Staley]